MTLADIMLAMHFYQDRDIEQWRHTRAVVFMMVRMWGDPKTVPRSITEFFPLPGDPPGFDLETFDIEKEFSALRAQGWNV